MSIALVQCRAPDGYRVRSESAGHFYHLNLPVAGATRVHHGNRIVCAVGGRRGVMLSPRCGTRFHGDGGFAELTVNIERRVLEGHFECLTGAEVRGPIEFAVGLDLRHNGGARLQTLLPRLLEYVGVGESLAGVALAEEAVLDTILLGLDHDHRALLDTAPAVGGRRLVRRAEEYIEAHAQYPLRIADVAHAQGVSTRTLQRAFRRSRGLSPREFLKRVRLDHALQILQAGDPAMTVTSAAFRSGHSHLGQFSVDFRERFRESPSMVLRRARG
jgi:AraC-like DNA-binding protein